MKLTCAALTLLGLCYLTCLAAPTLGILDALTHRHHTDAYYDWLMRTLDSHVFQG